MALADVEGVRAEDLARREVEEALDRALRRQRRLEGVVGADQVHAHRPHRALAHRVDACDRRQVDDVRGPVCDARDQLRVQDVALVEREVGMPLQLRPGQCVAVEVVDGDDLVLVHQAPGEGRADEAGAARHHDALSCERHGGESTFSDC
jgi:hypothetical protein